MHLGQSYVVSLILAALTCQVIGASAPVRAVREDPQQVIPPLPSAILTFPVAIPVDVGNATKPPRLEPLRSSSYLKKAVLYDRVPGGYAAFKAHLYTVDDPLHHFSVLGPMRGCGNIDTPRDTADAYIEKIYGEELIDKEGIIGCDVATNAGYFDADPADGRSYSCCGPVVSDGSWANRLNYQNVLFGISRPKSAARGSTAGLQEVSYFFGYLNETEFDKHNWIQLISGAGWLVRDGKPYIQSSIMFENFTAMRWRDGMNGEKFRTLKAPRLSVGVNDNGQLMILAIDGSEPDWDGLTLDDVAAVMVQLGAVQAVNLDGGSSVSVFENDDLVNFPSGVCPNATFPKYRCPRPVSSVLCVHSYRSYIAAMSTTPTLRFESATEEMSVSTYTMSHSSARRADSELDRQRAQVNVVDMMILLAKIMIPGVLGLWLLWFLLVRYKECEQRRAAGRLMDPRRSNRVSEDDDLDEGEEDDYDDDDDIPRPPKVIHSVNSDASPMTEQRSDAIELSQQRL